MPGVWNSSNTFFSRAGVHVISIGAKETQNVVKEMQRMPCIHTSLYIHIFKNNNIQIERCIYMCSKHLRVSKIL